MPRVIPSLSFMHVISCMCICARIQALSATTTRIQSTGRAISTTGNIFSVSLSSWSAKLAPMPLHVYSKQISSLSVQWPRANAPKLPRHSRQNHHKILNEILICCQFSWSRQLFSSIGGWTGI